MGAFGIISTQKRLLREHALVAQLIPVLLENDCFISGILTRFDRSIHFCLLNLLLYFKFLLRLSPDLLPHVLSAVGTWVLIEVENSAAVGDCLVIALAFRKCSKGFPACHIHAGKITSKHVSCIRDTLIGIVNKLSLQFRVPLGRRGTTRDVALDNYRMHRGRDDP